MKTSPPPSNPVPFSATTTLAVLFVLCAALANAQAPDTSSLITDHIRGVVLNSVDHRPVPRVLVVSNDQRMATFTDSEGRFSFDIRRSASTGSALMSILPAMPGGKPIDPRMLRALRSSAGSLNLRKPGYIAADVPLRISPDPGTTSEDLQFKLVPACVIRGHVSTPTGNPPSGLMVHLRSRQVQSGVEVWTQAGTMRVNSHGEFHFSDLSAGDYKVMSSVWTEESPYGTHPLADQSSGYKPAFSTEALDFDSAPAIHLHPGDTVEADLNLRSATLYHVSVPLLPNADNGSVSAIVGNKEEDSGYSLGYNFYSKALDGFLPNGAYDIRAFGYGQQASSGRGRVEVHGAPVKAAPITLVPDGQIPIIVHQQFSGVTPEQGQGSAIARAQAARPVEVFLRPYGSDGPGANMGNPGVGGAGNSSNLYLAGVAEGRYRVIANAYRGYVSAITANGVDLLRQPLIVGPGGASEPIEITLRDDSASLTGTISFPEGQSESDAQVFVNFIPLNDSTAASLPQAGAFQGKFMMPNLQPGQYLVFASSAPPFHLDYLNPGVVSRLQSRGTTITLAPGEKREIQVPLLSDLDDLAAGEN